MPTTGTFDVAGRRIRKALRKPATAADALTSPVRRQRVRCFDASPVQFMALDAVEGGTEQDEGCANPRSDEVREACDLSEGADEARVEEDDEPAWLREAAEALRALSQYEDDCQRVVCWWGRCEAACLTIQAAVRDRMAERAERRAMEAAREAMERAERVRILLDQALRLRRRKHDRVQAARGVLLDGLRRWAASWRARRAARLVRPSDWRLAGMLRRWLSAWNASVALQVVAQPPAEPPGALTHVERSEAETQVAFYEPRRSGGRQRKQAALRRQVEAEQRFFRAARAARAQLAATIGGDDWASELERRLEVVRLEYAASI